MGWVGTSKAENALVLKQDWSSGGRSVPHIVSWDDTSKDRDRADPGCDISDARRGAPVSVGSWGRHTV